MASSVEIQVSPFNQLASNATHAIERWENGTSEREELFRRKNFFGTLQYCNIHYLKQTGSRIGEHDRTGFGSSFLYLRLMRKAVAEILSGSGSSQASQDNRVLSQWLEATELAVEIASIFDYFRVRVPGVLSQIEAGNSPADSWTACLLFPFISPSGQVLTLVAERIVEKIQALKRGERFGFVGGSSDHEIVYSIEKNQKGNIAIWEFDPGKETGKRIDLTGIECSELSFWVEMCRMKFSHAPRSFEVKTAFQSPFQALKLTSQVGDTCFAHAHLMFLRYFLMKNLPSAERVLEIEHKIKDRIFENCVGGNEFLLSIARGSLEREWCELKLKSDPKAFVKLARFFLNEIDPGKLFCRDLPFMRETYAKRFKKDLDYTKVYQNLFRQFRAEELDKLPASSGRGQSSKKRNAAIVKRAHASSEDEIYYSSKMFVEKNFPEIYRIMHSLELPQTKINPFFLRYVELRNQEQSVIHQEVSRQIQATVEVIESAQGSYGAWISERLDHPYIQSLIKRCRLTYRDERMIRAYLNGVSTDAFFGMAHDIEAFCSGFKTSEEVLEWASRISSVLTRTASAFDRDFFINGLKNWISASPFSAGDPQWEQVKLQLLDLVNPS